MTATTTEAQVEGATVDWTARRLAILAAVALLWSYVSVLWTVTTVVGGRTLLAVVVAGALLAGTAGARLLAARTAGLVGAAVLLVGLVLYALSVPQPFLAVATVSTVLGDAFVLLSGNLSIMLIVAADVWAVSMAPAPVFLTWYLALRRRYELAALVGMGSFALFVLTGDAPADTTLIGATSALALLGFGAIEGTDYDWRQLQDLGLVLVVAVLAARLFRLVPERGFAAGPTASGRGPGTTMEGGLVATGQELPVLGSVSLSPTVRFEVTADRPRYWHAGAYDRYTGERWLRSGQSRSYLSALSSPPGDTESLTQRFEVQSSVAVTPAAWRPTAVRAAPSTSLEVTSTGSLVPDEALEEGDSYTVVSELPTWSRDRLREAGTDYPAEIDEKYFQVPRSTPDRLAEHAAAITADAATPYDAAVAIEAWLAEHKEYSLTVDRPDEDVADGFVFGMDAGYCTYFATAMAVMLRTQGIPSRLAVGYTPGERVDDDRWVVRGLDSHAWVDVYFPEIGWVPFDPTPASERRELERERLDNAREAGDEGIDTDETGGETDEPTPTPTPPQISPDTPADDDADNETTGPNADLDSGLGVNPNGTGGTPVPTETATPEDRLIAGNGDNQTVDPAGSAVSTDGESVGSGRDRDRLTLLAGVAGVALGAYRLGLFERGYDALRLRVQRRTDSPDRDAVVAYDRLELLLADRARTRLDGETPRVYLRALDDDAVDDRAYRVVGIYERAHYGDGVDRTAADEAIRLVDELVSEYGQLP